MVIYDGGDASSVFPPLGPADAVRERELEINKKNTIAFIAAKPSQIALTPRVKEDTEGGGWRWEIGEPREEQTLRIIELGMQVTPPVIQLTNGKQRTVEFWLLGSFDAVMDKGDFWESEDGRVWEIGDIIRDNGYETRGLVAERGE